jgi:hypothetical protein
MSDATDFGKVVETLINDSTLKTLMNISVANQSNYGLLADEYFIQTYVSSKFIETPVCRLLINSWFPEDTNNQYVKLNYLRIESYVPVVIDLMSGFESRTRKISDRLRYLLNHKEINYRNLVFKNSHGQASGTNYFERYITIFEYKKVYT